MMKLGIDVFIQDKKKQELLKNKRIAFLGHQASVNKNLQSSLSLIQNHTNLNITCVLGPQHGFYGAEQANMITTENSRLNVQNSNSLPVFSLYSNTTRRLTPEMLDLFDVLLVDLQDTGCRVYTYLSTLIYALEDCENAQKEIWILDRPNPAGRVIEGSILNKNYYSFVGAVPVPMRHGMTLGETASWYSSIKKLKTPLTLIKMHNYQPDKQAWPEELAWTLTSPNMTDTECVRCYSGAVLLEGTQVSEARGTVFPLKAFGFPGMPAEKILTQMQKQSPQWLKGCALRVEYFKPVFDKFKNQICRAIRIYADKPFYKEHTFRPYRLISLFLKCLKQIKPDFCWLSPPPYEYEYKKPPLDILSGDDFLRKWIEDDQAEIQDLEQKLAKDENQWRTERKPFLFY